MQFKFPKHPVGAHVWFLSKTDRTIYGRVDMISIVLKSDETVSIYYGIIDEKEGQHTVDEHQVIENRVEVRHPKFNTTDEIAYEFTLDNNQTAFDTGIITAILMTLEEGTQAFEYIVDDDWDYRVSESEILGMADSTYNDAMGD